MNQGKLGVVKQEMARVNVNILGISELKWTGMGEFNSDDHYIYYCGQESLRRNGVAIMSTKEFFFYSIGHYFHHQAHHFFWSYFSALPQLHIGHLPTWGAYLPMSYLLPFDTIHRVLEQEY